MKKETEELKSSAHKATRHTHQRRIITESVKALCHPTIEQIWAYVLRAIPSVSKTTIYRNINRMVDEGELKRLDTGIGVIRYDCALEHHDHIHCERCGRIEDLYLPSLERLDEDASAQTDYRLTGRHLSFRGICPQCQKANSEEPPKLGSQTSAHNEKESDFP